MQKTGKIIALGVCGILVIGVIIFSRLSYKICWNCSADEYFIRGTEYVCEEKKSYRQTGLDFLENSADMGHLQAELTLAELYSNSLPYEYVSSFAQQKRCLRQDVAANQETGLSHFKSVLEAVKNEIEADAATLNNLTLLYFEGFIGEDARGDEAQWLYEKAAASGSFPAMVILGKMYHEDELYSKALPWLVQASENPADFQSPFMVADYYFHGKGAAVDYEEARNWYNKAFDRAGKSKMGDDAVRRQVENLSRARLVMVERKLEEPTAGKQQLTVHYSLAGGVKHFIIFAADHPGESIGEVINDKGSIYATINENLTFSNLLPEPRQDDFSSMTEGMRWVLNVFGKHSHKNPADKLFDFVLTEIK